MPLEVLTTLAALSALSSLGATLFGEKGERRTEQIGGPSEEDVQAAMAAMREGERGAAYEGARTAAHMAGGRLAQMGAARGGAPGAVAGNISARLAQQLGGVEQRVTGEGARMRSLRRFESYYDPSASEEFAAITGRLAGAIGPAAMLAQGMQTPEKTPGPGAVQSINKSLSAEGADASIGEGWSFPDEQDRMSGLRGLGMNEVVRRPVPFVPSVEEPIDPETWDEIMRISRGVGTRTRGRSRFPAAEY